MPGLQEIEMRLRGRPPSDIPASIGRKLLHLEPAGEAEMKALACAVHWTYGTLSGIDRSLLAWVGIKGPAAAAVHFAVLWTCDMSLLAGLGLTPAPWKWNRTDLAVHTGHRLVLAVVTSKVYDSL
jgi:hypothetical protein